MVAQWFGVCAQGSSVMLQTLWTTGPTQALLLPYPFIGNTVQLYIHCKPFETTIRDCATIIRRGG